MCLLFIDVAQVSYWNWKVIKVIWQRGKVSNQWKYAEGVWIPKEKKAKNIEQFWIISLLSTKSKIFFSIISQRLLSFLLKNKYIDTLVQKGGILGMPGCVEHIGVLSQLNGDTRRTKGWLDLAYAYRSIPHKLVKETLIRVFVPNRAWELLMDYYNQFHLRISSDSHRLKRYHYRWYSFSHTICFHNEYAYKVRWSRMPWPCVHYRSLTTISQGHTWTFLQLLHIP